MRYFIIFGITFLLVLIIIFFNPFLGSYNKYVNIEFDLDEPLYNWSYKINGESLVIDEEKDNHWIFKANKNGVSVITFTYSSVNIKKYEIYYKFRVIGNRIFWVEGVGKGVLDYPNPY